jgi:rubrerythrin
MMAAPLLGTAVIMGASRSSARHEVARQEQLYQNNQMANELRRRDEEDRERRTQAAIDEAIAKERQRVEQVQAGESGTQTGRVEFPPVYSSDKGDVNPKKYCRRCGGGCGASDKFCTSCGCKLETA